MTQIDFTAFYKCLFIQFPNPLYYCLTLHMAQKTTDLFMWVLFSIKAAVTLQSLTVKPSQL